MTTPATSTSRSPLSVAPPRANLRPRLALQAFVLAFALTAVAALAILLGSQVSLRADVTATREHQLSPQTRSILAQLNEPLVLVVGAEHLQSGRERYPGCTQRDLRLARHQCRDSN